MAYKYTVLLGLCLARGDEGCLAMDILVEVLRSAVLVEVAAAVGHCYSRLRGGRVPAKVVVVRQVG